VWEKVGVESERNTTPSSDWLTPLSHWLIHVEGGAFAEDTAIRVSRFAVVTCKVKSTDVSPPTADAGFEGMAPALILVGGVSFLGALRAPCDPFTTSLVPALVALLWEVAVLFHKVVVAAGVAGAELVEISASRGRMGHGGVGGCVHIIGRSDEGMLRNGG
jgi:hypothetical protein